MIIAKFKGNETIVWGVSETPMLDNAWYHCASCVKADESGYFGSRLSLGAKFCSNCRAKLDWDNLDKVYISDPEMKKKAEEYNRRVDEWNGALVNAGLSPNKTHSADTKTNMAE